jgi:hypothetical protein
MWFLIGYLVGWLAALWKVILGGAEQPLLAQEEQQVRRILLLARTPLARTPLAWTD